MSSSLALGVPMKLLHDAVGNEITAELDSGDKFRGVLESVEDNMNMSLTKVTHTDRKGRERTVESTYLRGSTVVFFQLPETLKLAPCATGDKNITSGVKRARDE